MSKPELGTCLAVNRMLLERLPLMREAASSSPVAPAKISEVTLQCSMSALAIMRSLKRMGEQLSRAILPFSEG